MEWKKGTKYCVSCVVKGETLRIKCDMISWLGSGEGTVKDETPNLQWHCDGQCCQPDKIYNHLREGLLGMPIRALSRLR